jgi:hypothetical protein
MAAAASDLGLFISCVFAELAAVFFTTGRDAHARKVGAFLFVICCHGNLL